MKYKKKRAQLEVRRKLWDARRQNEKDCTTRPGSLSGKK